MKDLETIIEEHFGIKKGADDLTPMDYGECKKAMQLALDSALQEAAEKAKTKREVYYEDKAGKRCKVVVDKESILSLMLKEER